MTVHHLYQAGFGCPIQSTKSSFDGDGVQSYGWCEPYNNDGNNNDNNNDNPLCPSCGRGTAGVRPIMITTIGLFAGCGKDARSAVDAWGVESRKHRGEALRE
jgi:hypothetical protein